jgi:hypothetical protein
MVGLHPKFALGFEPEFHIPPFGLAPLYPDFMSAFADMMAFLQFRRRHFGLIGEFVECFGRPVVGDYLPHPSIAFGPSTQIAYSLHLDTSRP